MLAHLDPLIAEWFATRLGEPTEPQRLGWPEIHAGHDVLISAPTGSGEMPAAFLTAIDRLARTAPILRRMEARGEIRGGRFASGLVGEQFALPEALELLRAVRRAPGNEPIEVSATDPLNLAGIILPRARECAKRRNRAAGGASCNGLGRFGRMLR